MSTDKNISYKIYNKKILINCIAKMDRFAKKKLKNLKYVKK